MRYDIQVDLIFFKNKDAYDARLERFNPAEIGVINFKQSFTAAQYAGITSLAIHNYIKAQIEAFTGNGTVSIVE